MKEGKLNHIEELTIFAFSRSVLPATNATAKLFESYDQKGRAFRW